jgi:beta-N-acetylhexosaminidase
MSGHLSFPRILGNDTPSSLSPIMMVDLLRNRLGFQGIAVTDDLEMEGVLRGKIDMSVASRMALEAGNDVILLSHVPEAQEQAWSALLARMRVPTFRARVLEAVGRILRVKLEYFRGTRSFPLVPDPKTATRGVPAAGSGSFWFDQAARSVTALRGRNLPYRPQPGERILIVSPYGEFLEAGRLRYPGAVTSHLGNGTDLLRDTAEPERRYDTIIYHLCATQVDHTTLSVLRRLRSYRGTLIVVSSFSPAYLDEVPWVTTALAVYGDTRDSYRAAFGALAGDFVPAGKLPVGFMRL